MFDRNISAGVDIYRRDINSFNFRNNQRNTTFQQSTTGASLRAGVPLTEYISYNTLNSRLRPTRGETLSVTGEFAGLGGDAKYVRARAKGSKFWPVGAGFIFSVTGEGGWIHSFENNAVPGQDNVRLTDRFFLGEPQMRGFDIRGVGPRIVRLQYLDDDGDDSTPRVLQTIDEALSGDRRVDDSLGGRAYYLGRAELEIPLGSGARKPPEGSSRLYRALAFSPLQSPA